MKPRVHPALINAVKLYLIAQTIAEVRREQMNAIYDELLAQIPLFNDGRTRVADGSRITKNKDMYLSKDEEACMAIYQRAHLLACERGIKLAEMPELFCPALVAENLQCQAENHMLDEAGVMLGQGENYHEQVTYGSREKFVKLVIQMVLAYVKEHKIPFHPEQAFKPARIS